MRVRSSISGYGEGSGQCGCGVDTVGMEGRGGVK